MFFLKKVAKINNDIDFYQDSPMNSNVIRLLYGNFWLKVTEKGIH